MIIVQEKHPVSIATVLLVLYKTNVSSYRCAHPSTVKQESMLVFNIQYHTHLQTGSIGQPIILI